MQEIQTVSCMTFASERMLWMQKDRTLHVRASFWWACRLNRKLNTDARSILSCFWSLPSAKRSSCIRQELGQDAVMRNRKFKPPLVEVPLEKIFTGESGNWKAMMHIIFTIETREKSLFQNQTVMTAGYASDLKRRFLFILRYKLQASGDLQRWPSFSLGKSK